MPYWLYDGLKLGKQPRFLPPDVLAQFEAGFNVTVINAESSELMGSPSDELVEALNHECYHLLQTVCSGFGLRRAEVIRKIVVRHVNRYGRRFAWQNWGWLLLDTVAQLAGGIRRFADASQRISAMAHTVMRVNELSAVGGVAGSDPSVAAAALPGMFDELEAVRAALWTPRTAGLSDGHVMEGAAVCFTAAVTAMAREGAEILTAEDGAALDARVAAAIAPLGAEYTALLDTARARAGGPTMPWLVPAAALALRYDKPGAAVLPLLARLRAAPAGAVLPLARSMGMSLPALPGAGAVLGSGRELHRRRKTGAPTYAVALATLDETDTPDEIGVLCDVPAFGDMPAGLLSSAMRFNDRVGGIRQSAAIAQVSVVMANLALRAHSHRAFYRSSEVALTGWAQDVINRNFGDPPSKGEEG